MKHLLVKSGLAALLATASLGAQAGLLAYYDFNGPAGTANDVTGNGFNATTVSGASQVAGRSGDTGDFAYSFDQSIRSFIDISLNMNSYSQLTMGAWVNTSGDHTHGKVISNDNGGFDRTMGLDSRVGGWSAFTGSGLIGGATSGAFPNVGEWQFLTVTFDQGVATKLYLDGELYEEGAANHGSGFDFTRIGGNPGHGEWFDGLIDDVFFYDEVLDGNAIERIAEEGVDVPDGEVPAPMTLGLMLLGLAGIWSRRKARK